MTFHRKIAALEIEADKGDLGFDFSLSLPHTNKQHGYTIPRHIFAIWYAKGCDCGLFIRGLPELRFQLGRRS